MLVLHLVVVIGYWLSDFLVTVTAVVIVVVLVLSPYGVSSLRCSRSRSLPYIYFSTVALASLLHFLNMGSGHVGSHNLCAVTTISRWRLRASGCCLLHGFLRRAFYLIRLSGYIFSASSLLQSTVTISFRSAGGHR